MRKITIMEHISLDGVIQHDDAEGFAHVGWTTPYRTPAGAQLLLEAHPDNFDLLLGRRTYDAWSAFWPKAGDFPMANRLNAATKYVATHRLEGLEWGPVRSLGADIMEGIRRLKSTDGPDVLVWGSSTLTSVLLEQGFVDEVVLVVYPVFLGRGKSLFSDSAAAQELAFISTKTSPTGVLINTYKYVGALPTAPPLAKG